VTTSAITFFATTPTKKKGDGSKLVDVVHSHLKQKEEKNG